MGCPERLDWLALRVWATTFPVEIETNIEAIASSANALELRQCRRANMIRAIPFLHLLRLNPDSTLRAIYATCAPPLLPVNPRLKTETWGTRRLAMNLRPARLHAHCAGPTFTNNIPSLR